MINAKINKGDLELIAVGDVCELLADVSTIIRAIYLKAPDKDCAEHFIKRISEIVNDDFMWISNEDLAKEMKKMKEKDEQSNADKIKELNDVLDEIKKEINNFESKYK